MDKNELVVVSEGCPVLADEIEVVLDQLQETADKADKAIKDFRDALLEAMIENEIFSCKVGKYMISQVLGKDTVVFDTDRFLLEQSDDVVLAFSEIKKTEPVFNLEKFKAEHQDLYQAYLESEELFEVDTKKLEKIMPETFEKYVSRVKSTRKPTIAIRAAKGK